MHIKTLYTIAGFAHLVIGGPTIKPVENLPPIGAPPPKSVHGKNRRAVTSNANNYPGVYSDTDACPLDNSHSFGKLQNEI